MKNTSRALIFSFLMMSFVLSFQNCSKVQFENVNKVESLSTDPIPFSPNPPVLIALPEFRDQILYTQLNTPVEFTFDTSINFDLLQARKNEDLLSNPSNTKLSTTTSLGGKVDILLNNKIVYMPALNFRGADVFELYLYDNGSSPRVAKITVNVANRFNSLKTAFAVRGLNCTMCHAKISSNIVTDYGYGSNWFLQGGESNRAGNFVDINSPYSETNPEQFSNNNGVITWLNQKYVPKTFASFYNWQESVLKTPSNTGIDIYVPKANIIESPFVKSILNDNTNSLPDLKAFLNIFKDVSLKTYFGSALYSSTSKDNSKTNIKEVNKIYIGSPTKDRILKLGSLADSDATYSFFKDSKSSRDLSGISKINSNGKVFYRVQGNFVCDGDLIINAPLQFRNATIDSKQGCRIYSTKTIFIEREMAMASSKDSTYTNLQLLSSEAIILGLGDWDSQATNLTRCVTDTAKSTKANQLIFRLSDRTASYFTRTNLDPGTRKVLLGGYKVNAKHERIYNDAELVNQDCRNATNGFKRLLLVAPEVHGMFKGPFSGAIISEIAIFSRTDFTFSYDEIFNDPNVSIFPLLDPNEYFNAE